MSEDIKVELITDQPTMEQMKDLLGTSARVIERRDLSGDATTLITLATASVNLISTLLTLLSKRNSGIKKIKVGGFEIENPSTRRHRIP